MKTWCTPGGDADSFCLDMLKQPHLLIAGSTGSGKSVLINTLIYTALFKSPNNCRLILIDPKRVELIDYKNIPHTLAYSTEIEHIVKILQNSVWLMEQRYKEMMRKGLKKSKESEIYIIIDEFADLMLISKLSTLPSLLKIAQLGRAANIHLIIATQRPTRDIITGQIKVNMNSRIALRCPTAQDSRNIIDRKGAERLPRYGQGYYYTPEMCEMINIPKIKETDLKTRIRWWEEQKNTQHDQHQ